MDKKSEQRIKLLVALFSRLSVKAIRETNIEEKAFKIFYELDI